MTTRWPTTLMPCRCKFGRSRVPSVQISGQSQQAVVSPRGRPLWSADVGWDLLESQVPPFRRIMEDMDGSNVFRIVWDFANPWPSLSSRWEGTEFSDVLWRYGAFTFRWSHIGLKYVWRASGNLDFTTFEGSLVVGGSYAAGVSTVTVTGWPANRAVLLKGDFIQLGEDLYLVAADVSSNAPGSATITLTTPLLNAITPASIVRVTEAGCIMRMKGGAWSIQRSWDGALYMAQAAFEEVV